MLWNAKIMSLSESSFWLTYFIATIPLQTKTNRGLSSLTNQGREQTWEICAIEQYEYKTDFNLTEGKGFTNGTKEVFGQNKSWLQEQKYKGSNAMVCQTNLHVSCLNKRVKQLVVYGEQEFSFSTFAAHFKFSNLFLLFLLILKHFQKVFKTFLGCLLSDMKCLLQHYSKFDFSWPIKAWHLLFLWWKVIVQSKCRLLFWNLL